MQNSYLLQCLSGLLPLPQKILEQLALDRNCVLYGMRESYASHDGNESLVLSTVPVESWSSTFKLVVHTRGGHGAVHEVTQAFADKNLNILSMSVAAFSHDAEACLTAIVDYPPDPHAISSDSLCDQLEAELDQAGCLSSSPVFSGPSGLPRVKLTPLVMLNRLGDLCASEERHRFPLKDWTLDLGEAESLIGRLGWRSVVLVNVDAEELCMRLVVLPEHGDYSEVSFNARLSNPAGAFSGHTAAAVSVFAEGRVNLFSIRTMVTSKESGVGEVAPVEEARLTFSGDMYSFKKREPRTHAALKSQLEKSVSGYAEGRGGSVVGIDSSFSLLAVGDERPLVFVATNAKPSMTEEELRPAFAALGEMQKLGLAPMNVDFKLTPYLQGEITSLIDLCPIFVSLYLPEEGNRLAVAGRDGVRYVPSNWTMFEEAYVVGKADRPMFRLWHESVFHPAFEGGGALSFNDTNYEVMMRRFGQALERLLHDDGFQAAQERCSKFDSGARSKLRDTFGWLMRRSMYRQLDRFPERGESSAGA